MAIAHVQDLSKGPAAGASVTVHLASNTTATNTLIAAFCLPASASVVSVTDSRNNRWIQVGQSTSSGGCAEIWQARGIQGGSASVFVTFSATGGGVNISEWSGIAYQSPLDQWSQNTATSASVTAQTLTPRTTGELIVVAGETGDSSGYGGGPPAGWTAFTEPANASSAAAWQILSGSVMPQMYWPALAASPWACVAAAFLPANSTTVGATTGPAGVNPLLQFPECAIQLNESGNFQGAFSGTGIWTDIGQYVLSMTIGPIGRSHMLDRVQATQVSVDVNGRDGTFNPWNTQSFLYPGGLDPMTPMRIAAAWNGQTSLVSYTYLQSITPNIADVVNVSVTLESYDIFQMLNLGYLSNDNYAQQVIADGGANLQAYYRFGDPVGSYSVLDSSGIGNTGSLIAGNGGTPIYGNAGPFLYDPSTSLDMTAGTNVLNGGMTATDNSTQPPTPNDPLSSATSWTFECWIKNTSTTATQSIGSTISFLGGNALGGTTIFTGTDTYPAGLAIGDLITGSGVPANTYITSLFSGAPNNSYVGVSASCAPTGGSFTTSFIATPGGAGSTLFAATSTTSTKEVDIRIGTFNAGGSVGAVANSVMVGPVLGPGIFSPVGFSSNQQTLNGAWHQVAVTYAASVATIYVDGALDSTWPSKGDWTDPSGLTIGCSAGPLNGWTGMMSDVALYSTTLTAAQISNHYSIGLWFQVQEYGASVGGIAASRLGKLLAVERLNPSQILNVPYPFRTLLYSETNSLTTTSGLNYIQTMTETEGPGIIFQGPNGMINAYSRQYAWLSPTTTTSQAVFADNTAASVTGYYDGPSLQIVQDDLDEWTDIQVQSGRSGDLGLSSIEAQIFQTGSSGATLQEWGPVQSPTMAAAASVWGSRTLQGLTSLQMEYDSDALALAQLYANSFNTPIRRVTSMTLNSQGGGGVNIPQQLQRGIYDRITIQYQGQTPGPAFKADSVIEQIQHTIDMSQPTWTTQFATSPYEVLLTPFIFGNAAQSQLAGAASVTGSGTSWIHHPAGTHYLSGTVVWTVASGATTTTAYNATAGTVQTALAALVPSTTCSGGPLNSNNVVVSFGSSQATFTGFWSPSCVLTL